MKKVFIILLVILSGCSSGPRKIEDMDVDAFVMSEDFVTSRLKTPSTAEFPVGSKDHVTYISDSTFLVNSYVDAQNVFGAKIRMNYTAKMKYTGNDNWQLVDMQLEDQ